MNTNAIMVARVLPNNSKMDAKHTLTNDEVRQLVKVLTTLENVHDKHLPAVVASIPIIRTGGYGYLLHNWLENQNAD